MTPADLRAIRDRLGLTQAELGRILGQDARSTVSRWEDGKRAIPESAEIILALMGRFPAVKAWLLARRA